MQTFFCGNSGKSQNDRYFYGKLVQVFLCYLSIMKRILHLFMIILGMNCGAQNSFFIGKTNGPLTFIKYGLGEDRLGGAKMGFLDSNIVIKVVDSVKDDY